MFLFRDSDNIDSHGTQVHSIFLSWEEESKNQTDNIFNIPIKKGGAIFLCSSEVQYSSIRKKFIKLWEMHESGVTISLPLVAIQYSVEITKIELLIIRFYNSAKIDYINIRKHLLEQRIIYTAKYTPAQKEAIKRLAKTTIILISLMQERQQFQKHKINKGKK